MSNSEALHPSLLYHVVNTLGWPSLRPLQQAAVEPLMRGDDALLVAPTAGGKTEAAVFPLLSKMASEDWRRLSVLYICPLRALLNNLEPRIAAYAGWVGRRAELRHGDTSPGARRRVVQDPPDVLLTTPESLEAMLVSTVTSPRELFADLRAVVVDEVHAFASDDRGWHLLAVLERIARLAGRPLQRVGLSATVGNPDELVAWLQGSGKRSRPASVVTPVEATSKSPDLQLDYVGTLHNAVTVISALHRGEKRLVFADSRRSVETLARILRERGVETFVSHSSLSADERRRAEAAFTNARDCVIVATSTLELGVDVGDLDRVIQVGAPRTVASLLQRLGRTGRRAESQPNMLLLTTSDDDLLQAAALLRLWSDGYVEPISPPPTPRHLLAQQLLALCLQEGRVGENIWPEWLDGLPLGDDGDVARVARWLVDTDHIDHDSGMLFVGPEADRRYGRRHFLELVSVFAGAAEVTILHGNDEVGTVDPAVLANRVQGSRILALGGRSWQVTHVDWTRRRAWVESTTLPGTARWSGAPQPLSFALCDAMRRVLLGVDPDRVTVTRRASARLTAIRDEGAHLVHRDGTVVVRDEDQIRWWTWAGGRANTTIGAALSKTAPELLDETGRFDNRYLRLHSEATTSRLKDALDEVYNQFDDGLVGVEPEVSEEAVRQLKFAELLPPDLAHRTLAERIGDRQSAGHLLHQSLVTALR
jgi:ATP-dependent Lhr-like helicase